MEDQHQHTMVDSSDTNMDSSTCMDSSAPSSAHGGESREQSPPVQTDPLLPPPESIQLKRSASSRLPVPRKSFVLAPIAVPPPYGSLRPAPSKELFGPKSASPRIPSLTKRPSKLGGLKSPNAIGNGSKYPTHRKLVRILLNI